jgi:transcriptional regulator with XRE-family HTH domain
VPSKTASAVAFGRAIRELRVERGLSQEELGMRSGVSRAYFGKVERGDANPTFETIVKVSGGLQVPAAELVALAQRYLEQRGPRNRG